MGKLHTSGWAGLAALVMLASADAHAGQAAAAPTKPVYAKPLEAPEIASDTRNLEAILNRADTPLPSAPALPAPAHAAAPPPHVAAPVAIVPAPVAAAPAAPAAAPQPQAQPQLAAPLPAAMPALQPSAGTLPPARTPVAPPPREPTILLMPSALAAAAPIQEAAAAEQEAADINYDTYGWKGWTSEPTSVFTALIALFTFILALAGGWHVYVAGATARRQLRAYVFITQTEINGVAPYTQPMSQLVIRNTGQTPAHDVVVYGNMVFDEFPLKKDLPVLVFSDPQLTKENLGPDSERYKWEYALVPLTDEQVNQMNAGTHALYVYGEIRYRDVFRKKRYTKYLYYTGGNMGIRGNILGGYPEGNKAI